MCIRDRPHTDEQTAENAQRPLPHGRINTVVRLRLGIIKDVYKRQIYQLAIALLLCFLQMAGIAMYGQDRPRAASKRAQRHQTDTLNTVVNRDSLTRCV